jgi:ubiquinone biosynthesis protein
VKPFSLLSNAVRAKEILFVLARHGFGEFLTQLDLPPTLRRRLVSDQSVRRSKWERVRLACEELGPAWVKFGQLLSMRPDVVPYPLILELRKLQNDVPPVPYEQIHEVLLDEWEQDPAAIFSDFNRVPAASGSLAQVYYAKLKDSGRAVAVKVQRPGIPPVIRADLELAAWMATARAVLNLHEVIGRY